MRSCPDLERLQGDVRSFGECKKRYFMTSFFSSVFSRMFPKAGDGRPTRREESGIRLGHRVLSQPNLVGLTTIVLKNKLFFKYTWSLNKNLLAVDIVNKEISKEIKEYFEFNKDCGVSQNIIWDAFKAVLRRKYISLSSAYKKTKEALKDNLLSNIEKLEALHKKTYCPKIFKKLTAERKKLEALELSQTPKNLLFLKQKFWHRSPKFTKLLSWRLRKERAARRIDCIRDNDGNMHTSLKGISKTFVDFFTKLYSSKSSITNISSFLNHLPEPMKVLSEEHKDLLSSSISPSEVTNIIKSLKLNKSPGRDGIPAEFYKKFY